MSAMRAAIFAAILLAAEPAQAQLLVGMDHIPIVVSDLEQAQDDFRNLGFAIKPGRVHADGIRNAHVKFADGTELELITAPAASDALTTEYRGKLKGGEGPVYFGLYAPDHAELTVWLRAQGLTVDQDGGLLTFQKDDPLHHLFFGLRQKAPTDRPEHFAHANTALRLSGIMVRGNLEEKSLLAALGAAPRPLKACGPIGGQADVAQLPEGRIILTSVGPHDGAALGAQVEVKSLAALRMVLEQNGVRAQTFPGCGQESIWLSPAIAHGIWLQFVEAP